MSDKSGIEWTDATWNPVTGCTKVSPGCDNCYAETFAERWRGTPGHPYEAGFDLTLRPERMDQPLRWTKPRRVFVNSMSDLFHDDIPDDFIASVFAVMALTPRHTYQLLTKRHARMRSLLSNPDFKAAVALAALSFDDAILSGPWPLPNLWLGVSVEDQKWADIRIDALRETPAAVRMLSLEPLLGPLDSLDLTGIGWVIVGGESGPGARPMHPDWVRSLRDQCTSAGVPFFFKQWGEWQDGSHDPRSQHGPDHVILRDGRHVPFADYADSDLTHGEARLRHGACVIARVGKKSAGRELDGRTWDEYPPAGKGRGKR
jgi:protein gp37